MCLVQEGLRETRGSERDAVERLRLYIALTALVVGVKIHFLEGKLSQTINTKNRSWKKK